MQIQSSNPSPRFASCSLCYKMITTLLKWMKKLPLSMFCLTLHDNDDIRLSPVSCHKTLRQVASDNLRWPEYLTRPNCTTLHHTAVHCTTSIPVIETLTLATYHKMFVCGGEKRVTANIRHIYGRQRLYSKDVSQFQVNVKMSSYSLSFCSVKQAADSVSDPIMQIGI